MAFIASFFRIPVLLPVIFKTIDSRKGDFCTCKTTKSDTIIADIDNFVITKFECADVDSNYTEYTILIHSNAFSA